MINPPANLGSPVDYLGLQGPPGVHPGQAPSLAPAPSGVLAALAGGGLPGAPPVSSAPPAGSYGPPGLTAVPTPPAPAPTPKSNHPFLETLHRELGIRRARIRAVPLFGKRWGFRNYGLDDQIWIWSKLPEEAALEAAAGLVSATNMLKLQAATVAVALAGIGPLLTADVVEEVDDPDWVPTGSAGEVAPKVTQIVATPFPDDDQPLLVPTFTLFPVALPAGYMTSVPADPFDPPNPWRHLVADLLLDTLLNVWEPDIARDLYAEQSRFQAEVRIPALPLPRRSPKPTTT